MIIKILRDKTAVITLSIIIITIIAGLFAPVIAPNDYLEQDIMNKNADYSKAFPLGTDHLGRCVLSRLIYGIRTTIFLSFVTLLCTVVIGLTLGVLAGYFKGIVDEVIMRFCDIMLSFPGQVMILSLVGILGVNITNVILANIIIKWTWYARMIRGMVIEYRNKPYMMYSRAIGSSHRYKVFKHIIPNISSEIIILSTMDMGWTIISISTLSFLGLGIQPPIPEWGAMLNEAKNVIIANPKQMIAPGVAISILVASFNLLGDSLRDILDPKGANS